MAGVTGEPDVNVTRMRIMASRGVHKRSGARPNLPVPYHLLNTRNHGHFAKDPEEAVTNRIDGWVLAPK